MGKRIYRFDRDPIFGSDSLPKSVPVTYQGNVVGSAVVNHNTVVVLPDEMYGSVFENMIYPDKSFSLEVRKE